MRVIPIVFKFFCVRHPRAGGGPAIQPENHVLVQKGIKPDWYIILSMLFLFPLPVLSQETPDCSQFKAALYTRVVILLEVQKEFERASEDHESAFEEYHQCLSSCSQLKKYLEEKTDTLLETQLKLEQASEDHESAFKEYHQCQGTSPVPAEEETS